MTSGASVSLGREAAQQDEGQAVDLQLDPAAMAVTAEGLTGLFWPVGIAELTDFRDRFVTDLFQWIRGEGIDRSRDAELVWLNAPQIVVEAMRYYNACAVVHRLEGRACLAASPGGQAGGRAAGRPVGQDTLFHAVAAGRNPAAGKMARPTLAGVAGDPTWRKALRMVKSRLGRSALPYRPRGLIRPGSHVVTFTASRLILAHAAAQAQPVVISRFDEWMTPGILPQGNGKACSDAGITAILGLLRDSFAAGGERVPDVLGRAFADLVQALCRPTAFHLEELARARLPHCFWSGSCGNFHNRIMARAVAKADGSVVGHDHGTSTGLWDTWYQTLNDLNYVDRFVTFSEPVAAGLRAGLRPSLLARPERPPRIEALPRRSQGATVLNSAATVMAPRSCKPIRSVMYVPTVYTGDDVYLLPLLADPVAVDWQARLLAFLSAEGYEVLIKPHPESHHPIPQSLLALSRGRIVEGPFEAVMGQADLLLFDYLQTSCLVEAVRSGHPMVLIDLPRLTIRPEVRALLARRAAIAPARFDDAGRVQIDWSELRAAIQAAAGLGDKSFARLYFPGDGGVG